MASLTKTDWNKIMRMLKSIYTYANFISNDEASETWYYSLCRYPKEHIEDAIRLWVDENKQPPTPADIKEYLGRSGEKKQVNLNDRWMFWTVTEEIVNGVAVKNEYATPKDWNESLLRFWLSQRGVNVPLTAIRRQ